MRGQRVRSLVGIQLKSKYKILNLVRASLCPFVSFSFYDNDDDDAVVDDDGDDGYYYYWLWICC